MRGYLIIVMFVAGFPLAAIAGVDPCQDRTFPSTFALIEEAIFANRGCTNDICHGVAAAGGLDLRAGTAYDSLIDVPAETVANRRLVVPGQAAESLLWRNLAAKTAPESWEADLRPMPLDPLLALSFDELEAVRLWIERGAPREGTVSGTDELLDACLPPPGILDINPLPPPPAGAGLQMKLPRWRLPAHSEREVCFAVYYDVTDQVPEIYRGRDGTTFRYSFHETRQNPISHHMTPLLYRGRAAIDDEAWGGWRCLEGSAAGSVCDPTEADACGAGVCTTPLEQVSGCVGYGPGDEFITAANPGVAVTQETAGEFPVPDGVFHELPLQGVLLWTSHAFNLTDAEGVVEGWLNFDFVEVGPGDVEAQSFSALEEVFSMSVPPFSAQELCRIYEFEENAHVFEWSSHRHKRAKRWRTYMGAFRCDGGPANGEPCSPLGYDFSSPDVCKGASCIGFVPAHVGDCDGSGDVGIAELATSVGIALGELPIGACSTADGNRDNRITVAELVTSVGAALNGVPEPQQLDPEESLFYTSLLYDDPLVLRPQEPAVFRGTPAHRSVTYCALYDNGFADPSEVKRKSTSVVPWRGFPGGPCAVPSHCTEGNVGAPCAGDDDATRDSSCDTSPVAGDGRCDACELLGGVTTDDEMFLFMGRYYIPSE